MNIKNLELIKRLTEFKGVFSLRPSINKAGMFAPTAWSRGIILEPKILRLLAQEFLHLVDLTSIDVIAEIELQGIPLATALAIESGKPMVMVREKAKRVGRSAIVGEENFLFPGAKALLVDDLMAFGGTKENCVRLLEERGVIVSDLAVFIFTDVILPAKLLNIDEGYNFNALVWLKQKNIKLYSLIDFIELARLQFEAGTISEELFSFVKEQVNGPYWEDTGHLKTVYDYALKNNIKLDDFVLQFMKEHGVKI